MPWTPQRDILTNGGLWFSYRYPSLADGAISAWTTQDGLHQLAVQGTGSLQPVKNSFLTFPGITFDGVDDFLQQTATGNIGIHKNAMVVPDGVGMSPGGAGKGVTCTGLCRIPGTTEFWMGNHGDQSAGHDSSGPWAPSLIRMREIDLGYSKYLLKVQEIPIAPLIAGAQSIQGVTFDSSDNTIWFTIATGPAVGVYHITQAGVLLGDGFLAGFNPNGIAYIAATDELWVNQESSVGNNIAKFSAATGAVVIAAASTGLSNQDMLHYDATTKTLLMTYGANGVAGQVRVYTTTGASGGLVNAGDIQLPIQADAIEGVVWEGRKLYLCNDSFYHVSAARNNEISEYTIVPPTSNQLSLHGKISVSTTTGTDCVWEDGTPLSGPGFGIYPTSATGINVFVNTGASGVGQQGSIVAAGIPSLVTPRTFSVMLDTVAHTGTLYIDGALVGTSANFANCVGGITNALITRIGTASDVRPSSCVIQDLVMITGLSDQVREEAYLMRNH
jgi:hypothetical protein